VTARIFGCSHASWLHRFLLACIVVLVFSAARSIPYPWNAPGLVVLGVSIPLAALFCRRLMTTSAGTRCGWGRVLAFSVVFPVITIFGDFAYLSVKARMAAPEAVDISSSATSLGIDYVIAATYRLERPAVLWHFLGKEHLLARPTPNGLPSVEMYMAADEAGRRRWPDVVGVITSGTELRVTRIMKYRDSLGTSYPVYAELLTGPHAGQVVDISPLSDMLQPRVNEESGLVRIK